MKTKKIILTAMVGLTMCGLLTGCGKEKTTENVMICKPVDKTNTNSGLAFRLRDDGVGVNSIEVRDGITEEFLNKWYPKKDKDKLYETYFNEYSRLLDDFSIPLMSNYSWHKASIESEEGTYNLSYHYVFDFNDEFYEDIKGNMPFLKAYGWDKLYNEDEKRFEVSEKKVEDMFKDTWIEYKCETKEMPIREPLK